MSGGQLVVLDRLGRDVKRYPLPEGLATIGSDPACDIRVMLSSVSPHHATVVVHANQTVVRNVSTGETLVNGQPVSVAALRHKDRIELGGRVLRWEYSDATAERPLAPEPAVYVRGRGRSSRARRATAAATAAPRSPAVRLRLEMTHRASMPGSVGGKQVAIVQPQRRDTAEQNEQSPVASKRARPSAGGSSSSPVDDRSGRRTSARSPAPLQCQETKATLWIESRKTTPRKTARLSAPGAGRSSGRASGVGRLSGSRSFGPGRSSGRASGASGAGRLSGNRSFGAKATPLRLAVLKRRRAMGDKIQAPTEIDPTKQAAIMLMAGRSARAAAAPAAPAPAAPAPAAPRHAVTLELNDSRQSSNASLRRSPALAPRSPKKSALKDPSAKKTGRKTDSIKFDLSNLDNYHSQDVFLLSDVTPATSYVSSEDENVTLHYDTSSVSPSPRRSIHSRSSRISERTETSTTQSSNSLQQNTLTPGSGRKSSRGSIIVRKVLETPSESSKRYSTRTTKSVSDSYDSTVESAFKTRTLSPRSPSQRNIESPRSPSQRNMESYSIVDLVSVDSNDTQSSSVYGSGRSRNSSNVFGTPQNSVGRKTRSIIDRSAITSSTPYVGKTTRPTRSLSSPNIPQDSVNDKTQTSRNTRRSKSLTTPENSQQISLNTTRVSRGPRSRSRINDSELMLISSVTEVEDSSPKSSKRLSRNNNSTVFSPLQNTRTSARKTRLTVNISPSESPGNNEGMNTPDNKGSPEEAGTPVLSIQSLLDSSHNSSMTRKFSKKGRTSKRHTIGGVQKKSKSLSAKSKSLNFVSRRSARRQSKESSAASDKTEEGAPAPDNEDIVTPKSGVKLVPEHVKNKHSTAKKPQSKRSIIDDLNNSDIVKQLFNSPVKRKLSQSMSEYSRKQLLDDDEVIIMKRPTRHTVANAGRTPEQSPSDRTEAYSVGVFVSPLNTPDHSPNLTGVKRLLGKQTPKNVDSPRDKNSTRSPRPRRSIANDLTRVSGVKKIFARSPKNRLSDVRVKELFAPSQRDDLRRVSGVKTLFKSKTPRNDLRDVRGVKKLFSEGPNDDLRNVSGVKRILRRNSPRNDLSDVRGVRKMFRRQKETADALANVSGVEELFNDSNQSHKELNRSRPDSEVLFDKLLGRPPIRAVYSKSWLKPPQKPKTRRTKSFHVPVEEIAYNVEEWLERELKQRLQRNGEKSADRSLRNELKKLATDTVEGEAPLRSSKIRNRTIVSDSVETSGPRSLSAVYSARKLPLKKRSLVARLPIKKRAVLHSTPVKGRRPPDDELGRVSPIAADDDDAAHLQLTSAQQTKDLQETEPPKNTTKNKSKTVTPKTSPKKTRASQAAATSVAGKSSRTRKTNNSQAQNVKKRRASLLVTKKAPILSPQPPTKATTRGKVDKRKEEEAPIEPPTVTPKKRTTRRQKVDKSPDKKTETSIKTPKRTTRAKVQRMSVIVTKPSPKMKPAASKEKADVQPEQKRRTRKTTAPTEITDNVKGKRKTESPKESPEKPATRTRKTAQVVAKPQGRQNKIVASPRSTRAKTKPEQKTKGSNTEEKPSNKTRGRKLEKSVEVAQDEKANVAPTRGKRAERKQVETKVEVKPTNTRNRTNSKQNKEIIEAPKTKGRKTEIVMTSTSVEKVAATRGKKTQVNEEIVQESKRTRGKRVDTQDSTQSEKRGQKTTKVEDKVVATVVATRGRKTKVIEEVVQESKRNRGKIAETSTESMGKKGQIAKVVEDKSRKRKSTMESDVPSKLRKTRSEDVGEAKGRGRKAEVKETKGGREVKNVGKETRATRTRANTGQGSQATSSSECQAGRGGRKRKTVADTSDKASRGSARKQPATKKSKTVIESPARRARGRPNAEVVKRSTRARR